MSTTPTPAPHVSWLKHFGQVIGKILGIVAHDAAPIADQAAKVAEIMLPQFATEIAAADNLIDNIAKQALVTEAITTGVGAATTSQEKLATALAGIGPEIDAWVASRFPGATGVSNAAKAGLVNAVVYITNELEGKAAVASSAPAPAAAGSVTFGQAPKSA
jgi:hypothetical protein